MKKKVLSTILCVASGMVVSAQTLTTDDVDRLRNGFQMDASTRAIQNILTTTYDFKSLALNHQMDGTIDHVFKYRVDVSGITNQKKSGRCWMFTSMNVLRPSVMKQFNLTEFDFSHTYLYFWDLLEKSNLFLENIIATASKPFDDREVEHYFSAPVEDGGVWNHYFNVGGKYGVVPASVMPETENSYHSEEMLSVLNEKLRVAGYALREQAVASGRSAADMRRLRETKQAALADVYRILALCIGEPPTEFEWRYTDADGRTVTKKYTPKEFYDAITPADYSPENYIMIMNDPTREYYKLYEISNYRNTIEGINWVYLNLPNEDIKQAALKSIKNNEALYAACDVNKFLNRETGIMDPALYDYESLFGVSLSMDKKARILTRQSSSEHAMTLIGVDTDDNDIPVKWQFENSWGTEIGHDGYLTFTDKWFDEYMFRFVIHRRYLNHEAIAALSTEHIVLPPWDYMF